MARSGAGLIGGSMLLVLAILLLFVSLCFLQTDDVRRAAANSMESIIPLTAAETVTNFSANRAISHAVETHGEEALAAYACFEKHPTPAATWTNSKTGNTAYICFEGQNFFLQIVDRLNREITAFKRNNAKSMGDVGSYLKAQGYSK